jgi:large subunit ribosomal protein L32
MPNPKRRHSKHRKRIRRSHHALALATPNRCAHCGAAIHPHRVCDNCGHYGFEKGGQKGVAVFEKESV